jgi:hypothetical protein
MRRVRGNRGVHYERARKERGWVGGGAANRQQKLREQLNLVAETCASVPRLLSTQSFATSLCFHFRP